MEPLVHFFQRPQQPNTQGFSLQDYLTWSALTLENRHDYIQWVFPLFEPSACNPYAPVLSRQTQEQLLALSHFQTLHRRCAEHQIQFWQLYAPTIPAWWDSRNHNCLRVTRALRSLRILGNEELAIQTYHQLLTLAQQWPLQPRTLEFWYDAVYSPIL